MGYPTIGIEGQVTSWGSGSDDCAHLVGTGILPASIRATIRSEALDRTGQGDGDFQLIQPGLRSWTATIEAWFPRATRKPGNTGLVTLAGGYVYLVDRWELSIESESLDYTHFGQPDSTWTYHRPGRLRWSGSWRGRLDSASAPALPHAPAASAGTIVLKASEEGATDNEFTGGVYATSLDVDIPRGSGALNESSYQFSGSGALTVVGSANVLPAGVIGIPAWDADGDGLPDRTLVFQSSSGRTYTGAAFWRRIDIACAVGELIRVTVEVQGSGPLALA